MKARDLKLGQRFTRDCAPENLWEIVHIRWQPRLRRNALIPALISGPLMQHPNVRGSHCFGAINPNENVTSR